MGLKKVKSNYFIVHPKVDQRAGLLSLPHLESDQGLGETYKNFTKILTFFANR